MTRNATPSPLRCDQVVEDTLVEQYVAHRLAPEALVRFEDHMIFCARCQAAVEEAVAVRSVLARAADAGDVGPRRLPFWLAPVVLAAAAGLVAVALLGRDAAEGNPFRDLAAVPVAPVYLGIPVRGAATSADSLFDAAMTAYAAERFDQAVRGLEAAMAAGLERLPAEFFLAASLQALGRHRQAADAFGRVIATGDSVYLAEARFYRAKVLLALDRSQEALDELGIVALGASEFAAFAAALADSVRSRLPR